MALEATFCNLLDTELEQASAWFGRLRPEERRRVQDTMNILNGYRLELNHNEDEVIRMAYIVAGSSVGQSDYPDIDLFALPEFAMDSFERSVNLGLDHPNTIFVEGLEGILPEGVSIADYGGASQYSQRRVRIPHDETAPVTVALFHELRGFDVRRARHPDDLLAPSEALDADNLIAYNQKLGSKFLVLSRQWPIN